MYNEVGEGRGWRWGSGVLNMRERRWVGEGIEGEKVGVSEIGRDFTTHLYL